MSTTTTTILSGRVIDTRYPDKPCHFCGTSPTTHASNGGGSWVSVCATCAVSWKAQVLGLLGRVDHLAEALPETAQATLAASITPQVNTLVAEALNSTDDASPAARQVVPVLLGLLAAGTTMAKASQPQAVRANRFGGKCGTCGTVVPTGVGRIAQEGGRWVTYHLDGQCPQPEAQAQAVAIDATVVATVPPALTEATRYRANGRDGKCLACGRKVEAGKGFAALGLPDARGWSTLHTECAEGLAADRHALGLVLSLLGDKVKALTGTDTRDHAVRLAVDFITGEGDGTQPIIFLRACWGAQPVVEVHTGAPGSVHKSPLGARRAVAIVRNLLALSDQALTKAQADYGTKMGECGRCGSPLTDAESRRIGLGPDCAGKHRH